jgi:predicted N-formylglutamate amidohydrolase
MAIGSREQAHERRPVIAAESGLSGTASGAGAPLLLPDEPPAFELINDEGSARVLVVCDHASRRIPERLDNLGLDELALRRHIACDIGAVDVARRLSRLLDAPAILASYSRLVVDCNRHLNDPTSILAVSDGEFVPGNHDLSQQDKELRAEAIFHPYHQAINQRLARFVETGTVPALIAVHSFTPIFNRRTRPWQIGILWDTDPRIPVPLMDKLGRIPGVVVGDNEPYSGRAPADYTIDHHAEPAGMPHVSIEVRQDLISTPEGADRWSAILAGALGEILADDGLYAFLAPAVGP